MTDRIARMRQRLLEKQHHVHRQSLPKGDWPYRVGNLPDYWRTAQRFRLALGVFFNLCQNGFQSCHAFPSFPKYGQIIKLPDRRC